MDDTRVSTEQYENNQDKYLGVIRCIECKKKAWYTKSYMFRDTVRVACFNAHHLPGCDKATSVLVAEGMENEDNESDSSAANADILVNLDRTKHSSIEVSTPADKHDGEEHNWEPSPQTHPSGNKTSDFSGSRSLRQILSYLVKNPSYGCGKRIRIVADNGREIIHGMLHDYLTEVPKISDDELQKERIFWGEINNYSEQKDGSLWLNYGSFREPSLLLDKELKVSVMRAYQLRSLGRFKGSHFIMVGWAGTSKTGKIILRTSQPKYINFINYRERLELNADLSQPVTVDL
ncbi:hypothetical protein OTK51_04625 [Vibrio scophthalmi]|uniref:hypothetical protein n=1 Tax=Vibrio scophthalmi TaxID=45658 RepID=UPI00228366D0|nr:hypothetical protein [Vibrio scophthalmi]MCY9802713.1 hypothetical protein [Vibrio scophthalmi]